MRSPERLSAPRSRRAPDSWAQLLAGELDAMLQAACASGDAAPDPQHRPCPERVDALFARLLEGYAADYRALLAREAPGRARHIRAYIRSASLTQQGARQRGRAIALLCLAYPHLQTEWRGFVTQMGHADRLDQGAQLACRLFADGLWLQFVLGPAPNPAAVDEALIHVLRLAESPPPDAWRMG